MEDTPRPRRSKRLLLRTTPAVLPSAHWISLGINERQADDLERLQRDLLAGRVTNDGSASLVLVGYCPLPWVPHRDSILPHWGAFARNLEDSSQSLTRLIFSGIEMTDAVWEMLSPVLHSVECLGLSKMQITDVTFGAISQALHSVKCLDLADGRLDLGGFRAVTKFLDGNSTLEELTLGGISGTVDGFDNMDVSFAFARAVKKHPTLQKLSTAYCYIGENADIAKAIIDGCENLEEVALVREYVGDECAKELASMIKRNKNLNSIYLYWNAFTEKGIDEIMSSVFDASSLNAIVESNHKVEIILDIENDTPDKFMHGKMVFVNGSDDVSKTIRYKVHRALFGPLDLLHWDPSEFSDDEDLDMGPLQPAHFAVGPFKEMNIQYFNVLPVGLAPRVFEFIQENKLVMLHEWDDDQTYIKHSWFEDLIIGRCRALSWVFQAMKSWCVPLVLGVATDLTSAAGKRKRDD